MKRIFTWVLSLLVPVHVAAMVPLDDVALADYYGQALFVADKIALTDPLPGRPVDGSASFTFYRMGMDVQIEMNLNMAKLQLGCGGSNDGLGTTPFCDIDMDYVQFMGRNGSQAGDPVTSDFILRRPYIELAIANDGSPTGREVVGIKIGGQSVDGFVGVGRRYQNGQTNAENGGVCGATPGAATVACHSGINALSGFIGAELAAALPAFLRACTFNVSNPSAGGNCGFLNAQLGTISAILCAGDISYGGCDSSGGGNVQNKVFVDAAGTRMTSLTLGGVKLDVHQTGGSGLAGLMGGLIDAAYAELTVDLRLLHGFSVESTEDFFLSFQRQPVSWPRYSKTVPANNLQDACNSARSPRPGRCGSAFAVATNTGWWMNVPDAKLKDVVAPQANLTGGIGQLLSLFGEPGFAIANVELGLTPPGNCYGTALFC